MWPLCISSFRIIAALLNLALKVKGLLELHYIRHNRSLLDKPLSSVIFIARIMCSHGQTEQKYRELFYFAYDDAALIVTNVKKQAIRIWSNLISGATNTQSAFYRPYLQATPPNYDESLLSSAKRALRFEPCYITPRNRFDKAFLTRNVLVTNMYNTLRKPSTYSQNNYLQAVQKNV